MFLRLKGKLTVMAFIVNEPLPDVSKVEGKVNWPGLFCERTSDCF